ncbi:MAG: short chain dehydrogenase [Pseudomonadales bacterium]|nr:short chain dehydrogenase [Pseudomonadales bacterium]
MKVLVIGGTGIIGKAIVESFQRDNEVICVGNRNGDYSVDIESKESIRQLFATVGKVDAIISATGKGEFGKFNDQSDAAYDLVLDNKVMGQVNLVRIGLGYLNQGGSITLSSGNTARNPFPGTAAMAMGCAAIEAFVGTAALEIDKDKRINVVSPSFVKETMQMMGMDSSHGIAAADVASYFQASVKGTANGTIYQALEGAYANE